MKARSLAPEPLRQVVDRLPKPRNWFAVQLFARGGVRICTPNEETPLLETVIQPDGDVITKVWGGTDKWEERVKAHWAEHEKKVRSRIDHLRRLRFALQKVSYLSVVPAVWGVGNLFREPFGVRWLYVLIPYAIPFLLLLVAKPAMRYAFQIVLGIAARRFSDEEWKPMRLGLAGVSASSFSRSS